MTLKKIISIASHQSSEDEVDIKFPAGISKNNRKHLRETLSIKNGFFCFESALRVLPSSSNSTKANLENWNDESRWKSSFSVDLTDILFFSDDIFGGQFGLLGDDVIRFDPETGEIEKFSNCLEGWANEVLKDYDYLTGYTLAHQWQVKNGKLASEERLAPKIPFLLGGEFSIENLYNLDCFKLMNFYGDIQTQISNLQPGDTVKINVVKR